MRLGSVGDLRGRSLHLPVVYVSLFLPALSIFPVSPSVLAVKKMGKAAKDPNKPKRAPSGFFVFMEGFRQKFKEEHPNNIYVAPVGKAAGQKWKAMTVADKAQYLALPT